MKDLSGLEVGDYFRIIWNRRWYFLIVFTLVSIGGTLYGRMQPPFYRSEAKIMVDTSLSSISRSSASINERVDAVREQLFRRTFLERMIQQTGSYGYGGSDDFVMERALDNIRKNIKITPTSDRTFSIAYIATDPSAAQNVTNQFTQELIRVSRRTARDRVESTDRFVERRFAEVEGKLNEQQEKIRIFKLQHAGKLPEQAISNQNALSGYFADLNNLEIGIQQTRNAKETYQSTYDDNKKLREQYIQATQSSKANPTVTKDSSPEERELAQKIENQSKLEAALAQALNKYTEVQPDVVRLRQEIDRLGQEISEAREKIKSPSPSMVEAADDDTAAPPHMTSTEVEEAAREKEYNRRIAQMDAEIARREKERSDIKQKIEDLELRIKTAPTLEQDLNVLMRDLDLTQRDYDQMATQRLNTRLATDVETDSENEVYQVIDDASFPVYPVTSQQRYLLMAFGGALIMGIAAAFGRELLDSTIGSEEEAKKVFKLPVLAAIPAAPKKNKKGELRKTA